MKRQNLSSTLIAMAIAAALPGTAQAVRVDYTVDAGFERDDNVTLSSTDPVEEDVLRVGVGFAIEQETSAVQASVAGRFDHRRYEDLYPDSTDSALDASLNWMIVPQRFGIVVEDSYGVQTIDRFEPDAPDNRQQVNVLSLGPNFYFNFGRTLLGQVEVRYVDSHAEITEDFNSNRFGGALRAIKALDASTTLSFNLQGQDVDFDNDLFARDLKRYEAFASYQRDFNSFDMLIDVGYSHLDYDDGDSSSNPLLRVELGWSPSERSRFGINAANQYSDAATSALDAIGDASGVPGSVIIGDSTVTASAYEERELSADYEYLGERTSVSLYAGVQEIEYIDALESNEESRGGGISVGYRLSPSLTLRGSASYDRTEFSTPVFRTENNRLFSLGLDKQWSRHWSSALSFTRYERTSPVDTAEFEQNVIYLSISYRNR